MLNDGSISQWLFSTLTVHGVLSDCAAIKDRIILENVPAGEEYLDTIKRAIKSNHRLHLGYKKFGAEGYVKTVCPYTLKLWEQRWYLLALNNDGQMRIYALDRVTKVELTDETFEMPADFSSEAYFSDYYGVKTDGTPMAHVVVRAHRWTPDYLRTLPLHHSQQELESGEITHADSSTTLVRHPSHRRFPERADEVRHRSPPAPRPPRENAPARPRNVSLLRAIVAENLKRYSK